MTAGLLPSPENIPSQTRIPEKQDNLVSSPSQPSSPRTKLGELVELWIQHPEFFRFVFQCVLTVVILVFCILQLAAGGRDGQGKNDALYWGGITSIFAWWMPAPGSGGPRNQANVTGGDINLEVTKAEDNPLPASNSASEKEK